MKTPGMTPRCFCIELFAVFRLSMSCGLASSAPHADIVRMLREQDNLVFGQEPPKPANTLTCDVTCPKCSKTFIADIGFRAGVIDRRSYKLGDKLSWEGAELSPAIRPADGNFKTVGYFECDNLSCSTWQDCYPEIQEALIIVKDDIILEAKPFEHRPNEIVFDIIEPNE